MSGNHAWSLGSSRQSVKEHNLLTLISCHLMICTARHVPDEEFEQKWFQEKFDVLTMTHSAGLHTAVLLLCPLRQTSRNIFMCIILHLTCALQRGFMIDGRIRVLLFYSALVQLIGSQPQKNGSVTPHNCCSIYQTNCRTGIGPNWLSGAHQTPLI